MAQDFAQVEKAQSGKGMPDPRAAEIFARIRGEGREPGALHMALARAPALLAAHYELAMALRHETSLDRRLAELAILRTCRIEGGAYPFAAHVRHALRAGVTKQEIASLGDWRASTVFGPQEKAVLAYIDALSARREVPAAIRDGLAEFLDPAGIAELTATAAFYASTARIACGLALEIPV